MSVSYLEWYGLWRSAHERLSGHSSWKCYELVVCHSWCWITKNSPATGCNSSEIFEWLEQFFYHSWYDKCLALIRKQLKWIALFLEFFGVVVLVDFVIEASFPMKFFKISWTLIVICVTYPHTLKKCVNPSSSQILGNILLCKCQTYHSMLHQRIWYKINSISSSWLFV